jgi:hypothetical protein
MEKGKTAKAGKQQAICCKQHAARSTWHVVSFDPCESMKNHSVHMITEERKKVGNILFCQKQVHQ